MSKSDLNKIYSQKLHFKTPNFLNVQRSSFEKFLNCWLITEFERINSITNANKTIEIKFHANRYKLKIPKLTPKQAILKRKTYTSSLFIPIQITNYKTKQTIFKWLFLVNLPLMTKHGHFIINGSPKIIINQIVRSPGVYFQQIIKSDEKIIFSADFIAQRGAWLRLEVDNKTQQIWAKLKRTPAIPLFLFLNCLGLKTPILNQYEFDQTFSTSFLSSEKKSLRKLYTKLYSNSQEINLKSEYIEKMTKKFVYTKLLNPRVYNLSILGRHRINKKLGLNIPASHSVLTAKDILFASLYLLACMNGLKNPTDIDDLKNRKIKPSGELLQIHFAIGLLRFEKLITDKLNLNDKLHHNILFSHTNQINKFHFIQSLNQNCFVSSSNFFSRKNKNKKAKLKSFTSVNLYNNTSSSRAILEQLSQVKKQQFISNKTLKIINNSNFLETRDFLQLRTKKTQSFFQSNQILKQDAYLQNLLSAKPLINVLREFFGTNPLAQLLDQTNPLAEITHKRRLTSLGPGGISRDTAGMAIRGIHPTHYGRICPIETPEGKNAGLVNSLTIFSNVNKNGFIETVFYKLYKGFILKNKNPFLFSSDQEKAFNIAPGDIKTTNLNFLPKNVTIPVRQFKMFKHVSRNQINLIALKPIQMISIATSLIPFLEHNDGNRALMGSNMQRQAVPTLCSSKPIVGTGLESRVISDLNLGVQSKKSGFVAYADRNQIIVYSPVLNTDYTKLQKHVRATRSTLKSAFQSFSVLEKKSSKISLTKLINKKESKNLNRSQIYKYSVLKFNSSTRKNLKSFSLNSQNTLQSQTKTFTTVNLYDSTNNCRAVPAKILKLNQQYLNIRKYSVSTFFVASLTESKFDFHKFNQFFTFTNFYFLPLLKIKTNKTKKQFKELRSQSSLISQFILFNDFLVTLQQKTYFLNISLNKKSTIRFLYDFKKPFLLNSINKTKLNFYSKHLYKLFQSNSFFDNSFLGIHELIQTIEIKSYGRKRIQRFQTLFSFSNHRFLLLKQFNNKVVLLNYINFILTLLLNTQLLKKGSVQKTLLSNKTKSSNLNFKLFLNNSPALYSISDKKNKIKLFTNLKLNQIVQKINYSNTLINKKILTLKPLNPNLILQHIKKKNKNWQKNNDVIGNSFVSTSKSFTRNTLQQLYKTKFFKTFSDFSYIPLGSQRQPIAKNKNLDTNTSSFQEISALSKSNYFNSNLFHTKINFFHDLTITPCLKPIKYNLESFIRTNQDTYLVHKPTIKQGEWVEKGDILADNAASIQGEICIGQNLLVGYTPWFGYNFEDAVLISDRLISEDLFTTIHIQKYEVEVRDTKFGKEIITKDLLTNISQNMITSLDERGIIKIGSWVKEGDILVGKIAPLKTKKPSAYEKLLYNVLQTTAPKTKDTSLRAPLGVQGRVIHIEILETNTSSVNKKNFSNLQIKSKSHQKKITLSSYYSRKKNKIKNMAVRSLSHLSLKNRLKKKYFLSLKTKKKLKNCHFKKSKFTSIHNDDKCKWNRTKIKLNFKNIFKNQKMYKQIIFNSTFFEKKNLLDNFNELFNLKKGPNFYFKNQLLLKQKKALYNLKKSFHLKNITLTGQNLSNILNYENLPETQPLKVNIYLAEKRKIQIGDKIAGRHGNKGIISNILKQQDMPYLPDGTVLDLVLNPLGVPSRMNVGQIFECLLGLAGFYLGENYKIQPFDEVYGCEASRSLVYSKLYEARLKTGQNWLFDPNFPGKIRLFDGRTGECFQQPVTVGKAYILKLIHQVDEKIHARSTGPYSLVTQQPLRGRSKKGGQRVGEMEVWALEGFGAAYILQELLTIKSDDIIGRNNIMKSLLTYNKLTCKTPESFKVLINELQSLCLDIVIDEHWNKL